MDGSIKETLDFMVLGYRGSLEELDQEEISPDESQGSSTVKVRDMAEKLKTQADRDRTRQNQRQAGRGGMWFYK